MENHSDSSISRSPGRGLDFLESLGRRSGDLPLHFPFSLPPFFHDILCRKNSSSSRIQISTHSLLYRTRSIKISSFGLWMLFWAEIGNWPLLTKGGQKKKSRSSRIYGNRCPPLFLIKRNLILDAKKSHSWHLRCLDWLRSF